MKLLYGTSFLMVWLLKQEGSDQTPINKKNEPVRLIHFEQRLYRRQRSNLTSLPFSVPFLLGYLAQDVPIQKKRVIEHHGRKSK